MALSDVAIERRAEIESWMLRSMDSRIYRETGHNTGRTPGALLRERLYMIVAQVQIPDVDGVHILDSNDNWAVFTREMKIVQEAYYCNADMSRLNGWGKVMYGTVSPSRSMERYFYKTQVVRDRDNVLFRPAAFHQPEVADGFPTFQAIHIRPGLSTWHDGVMTDMNLCHGEFDFSSDVTLKALAISFTVNDGITYDIDPDTSGTRFGIGHAGTVASPVEIVATPTNELTRVEYGDAVEFVPGAEPVVFHFKVIAEDDTEVEYAITVRSSV